MGELAAIQNQPLKQKAALVKAHDIAVKRSLRKKVLEIEELIKSI